MIRAEQIPDEVVEAAAKTLMDPDYPNSWPAWMDEARAAIAAALNAWPEGESIQHAIIAWALAKESYE
jgi:hypothetical protein